MGDGGELWAVVMVGSISTKQEGARGVRSTRMETFYSPAAKRRDEILGEWVLGTRIPRTRRLKKIQVVVVCRCHYAEQPMRSQNMHLFPR